MFSLTSSATKLQKKTSFDVSIWKLKKTITTHNAKRTG